MIPPTSREQILAALEQFDSELRSDPKWEDWDGNRVFKYAIEHEGRRYPVKQVVSLAASVPTNTFSGGPTANSYVEERGFKVVPLRPDKGHSVGDFPFASIYPDASLRRGLLGILAESIKLAHDANPSGWSAKLRRSKSYVNLTVGRIVVLSLVRDGVWIAVDEPSVDETVRKALLEATTGDEAETFRTVPGATLYPLVPEEAAQLWPDLRAAHERAVQRASQTVERTPVHVYFSEELMTYLESELEEQLPRPSYEIGGLTGSRVEKLLALLNSKYPGWQGFADTRFVKEEIEYKQATVDKAAELISAEALRGLIDRREFNELRDRLLKIGQDNNLLFQGVPRSGDLGILHQESLDLEAFSHAFFDLLYGDGEGPERLDRYATWVEGQRLPNKWTFPTYFLFVCHPTSELFIKPRTTTTFAELCGTPLRLGASPSADVYGKLLDLFGGLREVLEDYDPKDQVDLQSFAWVAAWASKQSTPLSDLLQSILAEYGAATGDPFSSSHPICATFQQLVSALESLDFVKGRETLRTIYSAGKGNWAKVPWVAILDERETKTTQSGVYVVLLFREDQSGVYVSLAQGVTEASAESWSQGRNVLQQRAGEARGRCDGLVQRGFSVDDDIDLRATARLGKQYEYSAIAHKLYETTALPPDEQIIEDLQAVLEAYDTIVSAESKQRAWIFQASPRLYDLQAALTELPQINWRTAQ